MPPQPVFGLETDPNANDGTTRSSASPGILGAFVRCVSTKILNELFKYGDVQIVVYKCISCCNECTLIQLQNREERFTSLSIQVRYFDTIHFCWLFYYGNGGFSRISKFTASADIKEQLHK
jgi:hypothetical protein